MSVYTFTIPAFREALLRAQKRGVDVRVITEQHPYESTSINRQTQEFLQTNQIPFHESNSHQFAFMHAKYMIFDDDWIIETANWTHASFTTNREFFFFGTDPSILANLANIFQKDFSGGRGVSTDVRLLAGPTNAQERLDGFLEKTQKIVDIYTPSLTDASFIHALSDICHA